MSRRDERAARRQGSLTEAQADAMTVAELAALAERLSALPEASLTDLEWWVCFLGPGQPRLPTEPEWMRGGLRAEWTEQQVEEWVAFEHAHPRNWLRHSFEVIGQDDSTGELHLRRCATHRRWWLAGAPPSSAQGRNHGGSSERDCPS